MTNQSLSHTDLIARAGRDTQARPIWLSGVYRSGTTFLTSVLNTIPGVAAASSTVKYMRFCLPHFADLGDPATCLAMLDEINTRIAARWDLSLSPDAVLDHLGDRAPSHAAVYNAVMEILLVHDKPGATRWAEKLAAQWRDIPVFLEMFPKGQVIHIVRDPRDVTASYKKMTYEPWPTYLDAGLNCQAAMREIRAYQRDFGADRILCLRAEDLAHDLAGEMERICAFLGEPFDPALANLEQFAEIKGEDWRTNTSFAETDPNYRTAARRWETHLSAEELFFIEMLCQPEMAHWGYDGSGQDLRTLDGAALAGFLADPWFAERLGQHLATGVAAQGYRTDPYTTEMKIVFGDQG